jgi:hypothetical protein
MQFKSQRPLDRREDAIFKTPGRASRNWFEGGSLRVPQSTATPAVRNIVLDCNESTFDLTTSQPSSQRIVQVALTSTFRNSGSHT